MAELNQLILLTSAYPAATGDASFVAHEIDALADQFDAVLVYNLPRYQGMQALAMPKNVIHAGQLDAGSVRANLRLLRRWSNLRIFCKILVKEWRGGRLAGAAQQAGAGQLERSGRLAGTARLGRLGRSVRLARVEAKSALGAIARLHQLDLSGELTRSVCGREGSVATTVYAFWGAGTGLAASALAIGRPAGLKRVVVRLHSYDLYEHLVGRLPLRASTLGAVDELLVISAHGLEYLRERYQQLLGPKPVLSRLGTSRPKQLPAEAAQIAPTAHPATALSACATELSAPATALSARATALSAPSLGPDFTVASCSSVDANKRVTHIFASIASLATAHPDRRFVWHHLGTGPLFEELQTQARQSPPNLAVHLHGQVAPGAVLDFYEQHRIDVFCNLSLREGVPVSIMEALSYGIAVVATDVGGTAELVGPELGSGELVPAQASAAQVGAVLAVVMRGISHYDPQKVWRERCDAAVLARRAAQLVKGA